MKTYISRFRLTNLFPLKYILFFILFIFSCNSIINENSSRPNILFIIVDDLRPQLNCFGITNISSPNIDKIAGSGIIFPRAYCQVPVCGASRASLLTGLRPSRQRFLDYDTWAMKDAPGIISLPEHFKQNGYTTISNGKVFHHLEDNAHAWSEKPWHPLDESENPIWQDYQSDENIAYSKLGKGRGPAYECIEISDNSYFDGKIALKSIDDLKRLSAGDQPFFLAVGFLKPHLPFNAPKKYWDQYAPSDFSLPANYVTPKDVPQQALHNWGELRHYKDIPAKGPLFDSVALKLIHGYYASVSYADAQIGRILTELDRLELTENTIIVLLGDHGWNLGEHGLWCKHSNYETSLRTPLIFRVSGNTENMESDALIEFIDIYPTLCEMAGIEKPIHLDGESLLPYFENTSSAGKDYVYSRFINGESVKSQDFRLTEWLDSANTQMASIMFNHLNDIDENNNIIGDTIYRNVELKLLRKNSEMRDR